MAALGWPRNTKDIDVVFDSSDDLNKAIAKLSQADWLPANEPMEFPDGFLLHRCLKRVGNDMVILDLLLSPEGWNCTEGRSLSDFYGSACWVISPKKLIKMKKEAGRPQDILDVQNLEQGLADD